MQIEQFETAEDLEVAKQRLVKSLMKEGYKDIETVQIDDHKLYVKVGAVSEQKIDVINETDPRIYDKTLSYEEQVSLFEMEKTKNLKAISSCRDLSTKEKQILKKQVTLDWNNDILLAKLNHELFLCEPDEIEKEIKNFAFAVNYQDYLVKNHREALDKQKFQSKTGTEVFEKIEKLELEMKRIDDQNEKQKESLKAKIEFFNVHIKKAHKLYGEFTANLFEQERHALVPENEPIIEKHLTRVTDETNVPGVDNDMQELYSVTQARFLVENMVKKGREFQTTFDKIQVKRSGVHQQYGVCKRELKEYANVCAKEQGQTVKEITQGKMEFIFG